MPVRPPRSPPGMRCGRTGTLARTRPLPPRGKGGEGAPAPRCARARPRSAQTFHRAGGRDEPRRRTLRDARSGGCGSIRDRSLRPANRRRTGGRGRPPPEHLRGPSPWRLAPGRRRPRRERYRSRGPRIPASRGISRSSRLRNRCRGPTLPSEGIPARRPAGSMGSAPDRTMGVDGTAFSRTSFSTARAPAPRDRREDAPRGVEPVASPRSFPPIRPVPQMRTSASR